MQKRGMTSFLGRSMVEMLGVLAIIGVLSMAALSGYQTAMSKYRLNKHKEQLSMILSNAIMIAPRIGNVAEYGTLVQLTPYYAKFNFIDKNMFIGNDQVQFYDVFKNVMRFYTYNRGYHGLGMYLTKENFKIEICRNILEVLKELHSDLNYFQIQIQDEDTQTYGTYWGDRYCSGSNASSCLKDIDVSKYIDICSYCEQSTSSRCHLFVTFPS